MLSGEQKNIKDDDGSFADFSWILLLVSCICIGRGDHGLLLVSEGCGGVEYGFACGNGLVAPFNP